MAFEVVRISDKTIIQTLNLGAGYPWCFHVIDVYDEVAAPDTQVFEIGFTHFVKNMKENLFQQCFEFGEVTQVTDPTTGKSTFTAVKKDTINTGGVAFALIKETILIYGKERDLIVYDRLQKKELFSILNVSFTGNWKEIRELHLP
jgi:hypothetical protein